MHRERKPADAALAMMTVLQKQQRTGRFGRELPDVEVQLDALPTDAQHAKRHELADYVVDADAVAAAIIARLLAGRTLQPPPSAPR
jgi:hypothetical protein